jgi:tripartite ATP-independent transporter DctP family solute receptor
MKKKITCIGVLILIAAMPAYSGGQSDSTAETKQEVMKFAGIANVGNAIEVSMNRMAENILERTKGFLKVEVYPGAVLGGEKELLSSTELGTIQAANIGLSMLIPAVPEIDIANLYYLFRDRDHMAKVMTGEIGKGWFAKYEQTRTARVLAANWLQGPRNTFTNKKIFTDPQSMKGIKIRVTAGVPLYAKLWTAMGALTVGLAYPEIYTSLQQGVVDACELPYDFYYSDGFYKVVPDIFLTEHLYYPNLVVINSKWMDSLPKDVQDILVKESIEGGKYQTQLTIENNQKLLDTMIKEGCRVHEVDKAAFVAAVKPLYKDFGDLYDKIMAVK